MGAQNLHIVRSVSPVSLTLGFRVSLQLDPATRKCTSISIEKDDCAAVHTTGYENSIRLYPKTSGTGFEGDMRLGGKVYRVEFRAIQIGDARPVLEGVVPLALVNS